MIIRTYECEDCKETFEVTCESNDGDPDCPFCAKVLEWRPQKFAITGVKSKAIDFTQKVLEEDYGLTNWKDNNRPGESAAIMPSENTAQREARLRIETEVRELAEQVKKTPENPAQAQAVNAFWGGPAGQTGSVAAPNQLMAQTLIASAKAGPQPGVDAMGALHNMGKAGKLPNNVRIVARG